MKKILSTVAIVAISLGAIFATASCAKILKYVLEIYASETVPPTAEQLNVLTPLLNLATAEVNAICKDDANYNAERLANVVKRNIINEITLKGAKSPLTQGTYALLCSSYKAGEPSGRQTYEVRSVDGEITVRKVLD